MIRIRRPSGTFVINPVAHGPELVTFTVDDDPFIYHLDTAVFERFVIQYREPA